MLLSGLPFAWHYTVSLAPNVTLSSGQSQLFTGTVVISPGISTADIQPPTVSYTWSQSGGTPAINPFCTPASATNSYTASNTTYTSTTLTALQLCQLTAPSVSSTQTYTLELTINSVNTIISNQARNPDSSACTLIAASTYNCVYPVSGSSSATVKITVSPPPPPLSTVLSANKTYISADQAVSFTNTTSGGSGGNVYSYSVSPSSGFTRSGNKFAFSSPGNYLVMLNVVDSAGQTANSAVQITVTPALTASLTANKTLISADQEILFTSTTSGGTGSNSYTYIVTSSGSPCSIGFGNSEYFISGNTITFGSQGTYTVHVTVIDASGEVANSNSVTITVTSDLATQLSANRTLISPDQSVKFTNTTSGGTGSNAYSYSISPSSGFTQNGNKFYFTSAGNYIATLTVTDVSGETANSVVAIEVTAPLATHLTANTFSISAGQSVSFTNTTTGGTGSNVYTYTVSPNSGFKRSGNKFTFTSNGVYTVTLGVSDKTGETANSSVQIAVGVPKPTIAVTLTPNRTYISADQGVLFTNTTSGGIGSNTYSYTVSPNSNFVENGNVINFTASGVYNVTLHVKDSSDDVGQSSAYINVTQPLEIKLLPNKTSISVGQNVLLTNVTTGGTGGYVYTYSQSSEGFQIVNNVAEFSRTGLYAITLYVSDKTGETANSLTVEINVSNALSASIYPSEDFIDAGQTVNFTNSTSYGTGGNTYSYSVSPDTGVSVSPTNSSHITFNNGGNYYVTLNVVDSAGEVATSTALVNVTVPVIITIDLTANQTTVPTGGAVLFTNTTTGGVPPYTYTYEVLPSSYGFALGNVLYFTYPGTYIVWLNAVDYDGNSGNSNNVTITAT